MDRVIYAFGGTISCLPAASSSVRHARQGSGASGVAPKSIARDMTGKGKTPGLVQAGSSAELIL